jgi:DNA-binding MarR family transcriptional regulator
MSRRLEVVVRISQLHRALRRQLDDDLLSVGGSAASYAAMSVVVSARGVTPTEIGETLTMTHQAASELLRALSRQGLVEGVSAPGDRRVRRYVATPSGREFVGAAQPRVDAVGDRLLSGLDPRARETVVAWLEQAVLAKPLASRGRGD